MCTFPKGCISKHELLKTRCLAKYQGAVKAFWHDESFVYFILIRLLSLRQPVEYAVF